MHQCNNALNKWMLHRYSWTSPTLWSTSRSEKSSDFWPKIRRNSASKWNILWNFSYIIEKSEKRRRKREGVGGGGLRRSKALSRFPSRFDGTRSHCWQERQAVMAHPVGTWMAQQVETSSQCIIPLTLIIQTHNILCAKVTFRRYCPVCPAPSRCPLLKKLTHIAHFSSPVMRMRRNG